MIRKLNNAKIGYIDDDYIRLNTASELFNLPIEVIKDRVSMANDFGYDVVYVQDGGCGSTEPYISLRSVIDIDKSVNTNRKKRKKQLTRHKNNLFDAENAFSLLNEKLFNGQIDAVLTMDDRYGRDIGSRVNNEIVKTNDGMMHRVIALNSKDITSGDAYNVVLSMMTQMIVIKCGIDGVKCCSGKYKNKIFKEYAERYGMITKRDKTYGWCIADIGRTIREVLSGIQLINRDIYLIDQEGELINVSNRAKKDMPKRPTSTRKYICPKCGTSFRATKDINVICEPCGIRFVKVENIIKGKK